VSLLERGCASLRRRLGRSRRERLGGKKKGHLPPFNREVREAMVFLSIQGRETILAGRRKRRTSLPFMRDGHSSLRSKKGTRHLLRRTEGGGGEEAGSGEGRKKFSTLGASGGESNVLGGGRSTLFAGDGETKTWEGASAPS